MRSYLLAATPRVGGNWLNVELAHAGLGRPSERLNWLVDQPYTQADLEALWDNTANDIYAVKVHLDDNVARLDLDDILPPGPRAFVYLTRVNVDAQALSLAIARAYDCWFSPRPENTWVSAADIAEARAEIDDMNRAWVKWFDHHGITPLEVTYEDLILDLSGSIARITEVVYAA